MAWSPISWPRSASGDTERAVRLSGPVPESLAPRFSRSYRDQAIGSRPDHSPTHTDISARMFCIGSDGGQRLCRGRKK